MSDTEADVTLKYTERQDLGNGWKSGVTACRGGHTGIMPARSPSSLIFFFFSCFNRVNIMAAQAPRIGNQ